MRKKLSKRVIDAIKPSLRRDLWGWDEAVTGFGIRTKPTGVKTFVVQYRDASRRTRRDVIGKFGELTPYEARPQARKLLGSITTGANPSAERKADALKGTVADLAELYLERHARAFKKQRSIESDESNLRLHVIPHLGKLRADAVTRAEGCDRSRRVPAKRRGRVHTEAGGQAPARGCRACGGEIAAAPEGKPDAEVVPIRGGGGA